MSAVPTQTATPTGYPVANWTINDWMAMVQRRLRQLRNMRVSDELLANITSRLIELEYTEYQALRAEPWLFDDSWRFKTRPLTLEVGDFFPPADFRPPGKDPAKSFLTKELKRAYDKGHKDGHAEGFSKGSNDRTTDDKDNQIKELLEENLELRSERVALTTALASAQEALKAQTHANSRMKSENMALVDENEQLRDRVATLEAQLQAAGSNRFLDEALNSGDGVYRP